MTDDKNVADQAETARAPQTAAPAKRAGILSAAEILAHTDASTLEYVDVPVPEWTPADCEEPMKVRLRVMTGEEAIEFAEHQAALNAPMQPGQARPKRDAIMRLVCQCAVDEEGQPLFTRAQLEELGKLSFAVLQRLQDKALVLNGFAEEDVAQEAAKNA